MKIFPNTQFVMIFTTIGMLAVSGGAVAQETGKSNAGEETYKDWKVKCVTGKVKEQVVRRCSMNQAHFLVKTKQKLFELIIDPRGKDGNALAVAITPLGILLAKGVAISVPGVKPFAQAVRLCNARGCIAPITFNPALRQAFMNGDKAAFQMFDGASGKPFTINVSLAGFSAAQKRLQELQPAN